MINVRVPDSDFHRPTIPAGGGSALLRQHPILTSRSDSLTAESGLLVKNQPRGVTRDTGYLLFSIHSFYFTRIDSEF